MSLFPHNYRKHAGYGCQGSPLIYRQAQDLAYMLVEWHSANNTDDWTQSADGADLTMSRIAVGLMAMLAEPSFVNMLEAVGDRQIEAVLTIYDLNSKHPDGNWAANAKVLAELGLPGGGAR